MDSGYVAWQIWLMSANIHTNLGKTVAKNQKFLIIIFVGSFRPYYDGKNLQKNT